MLEKMPAVVGKALKSVRPGLDKIVSAEPSFDNAPALRVTSSSFVDGAAMPARFTADGAGTSPALAFADLPQGTAAVVLIVEDADSPTPAPLCHLLAWFSLASATAGLSEGQLTGEAAGPTIRLGVNSFMKRGWLPPDPPTGHGAHRYCVQAFALDALPQLDDGAGRTAVVDALAGHVLAKGLLIGTYERA